MHDGSCIGINYAHRFPKCFRSLHTLLDFRSELRVNNSTVVAVPIHSISDLYANSLQRFTLRKWSCVLLFLQFLHRVNDRVRKMQDQSSKDATQDNNKHSEIW